MADTQQTVKWAVQIIDIISGPTKNSVLALAGLDSKLNATTKVLSKFERTLHVVNVALKAAKVYYGTLGSAIATMSKGILTGVGALATAADVAKGAFDAVAGTVLGGAAYREDTLVGMKTMLGSEAAANSVFDNAMRSALKTKFEMREVIDLYNKLLVGGFSVRQLPTLFAGIADVGTARGMAKAERLANALVTMQATGRTTWGTMRQAGLAGPGIPMQELAQLLGVDTTKNEGPALEKIIRKKLLGGVDSTVGIRAILERIQKVYDPGQKLGTFAEAQSKTLSGIYSNFKEAIANLFMSKEFGEIQGLKTVKQTMLVLTDLFDVTNPRTGGKAKQFLEVIGKIADDILGMFNIKTDSADALFGRMIEILKKVEEGVKAVTTWIRDELMPAFSDAILGKAGITDALKTMLVGLGKLIGRGIAEGMKEAITGGGDKKDELGMWDSKLIPWGKIFGKRTPKFLTSPEDYGTGPRAPSTTVIPQAQSGGKQAATGLVDGLKEGLEIHSPSRVMVRLARGPISEGLRIGFAERLQRGAPVPGGPPASAGRGGGGTSLVINGPVTVPIQLAPGESLGEARLTQRVVYSILGRASRAPGAAAP